MAPSLVLLCIPVSPRRIIVVIKISVPAYQPNRLLFVPAILILALRPRNLQHPLSAILVPPAPLAHDIAEPHHPRLAVAEEGPEHGGQGEHGHERDGDVQPVRVGALGLDDGGRPAPVGEQDGGALEPLGDGGAAGAEDDAQRDVGLGDGLRRQEGLVQRPLVEAPARGYGVRAEGLFLLAVGATVGGVEAEDLEGRVGGREEGGVPGDCFGWEEGSGLVSVRGVGGWGVGNGRVGELTMVFRARVVGFAVLGQAKGFKLAVDIATHRGSAAALVVGGDGLGGAGARRLVTVRPLGRDSG